MVKQVVALSVLGSLVVAVAACSHSRPRPRPAKSDDDVVGWSVELDAESPEVLFTFLAERYERRSVIITSNLVFSQWDRIFKDPMTTAAAIDRLVHHAVIVEMTGDSVRAEEAKKRGATTTTTTSA